MIKVISEYMAPFLNALKTEDCFQNGLYLCLLQLRANLE